VTALKIPGAPSGIVGARGLLWIVASDTGYLFRVDPHTAKLVGKPVRAGKALLTVAADKDRIWVGDSYAGAVNSVDVGSARVITRTKLPHVSDVAVGDGAVWATVDKPSELVRLDPKTGTPVGQPLPVPGTASGIAIAFGSIWVMTGDGVVRVQPSE
jgi:streptogramin lyase